MKNLSETFIIGKDGWPVEMIENRPITNFIRRILHGRHRVCKRCWIIDKQAEQNVWKKIKCCGGDECNCGLGVYQK